MITALLFNEDALLDEVAQAAKANDMHIISNGQRIVVSPFVPVGWTKIAVKVKSTRHASLEAMPCAA